MSASDQRSLWLGAFGIVAMVLIALAAQDTWITIAAIVLCALQVIALAIRLWQVNREQKTRDTAADTGVDEPEDAEPVVAEPHPGDLYAVLRAPANDAAQGAAADPAVDDDDDDAGDAGDGDGDLEDALASGEGMSLFSIAMAAAAEYADDEAEVVSVGPAAGAAQVRAESAAAGRGSAEAGAPPAGPGADPDAPVPVPVPVPVPERVNALVTSDPGPESVYPESGEESGVAVLVEESPADTEGPVAPPPITQPPVTPPPATPTPTPATPAPALPPATLAPSLATHDPVPAGEAPGAAPADTRIVTTALPSLPPIRIVRQSDARD